MALETVLITADDCVELIRRVGLGRVMDDLIGRIESECRSPDPAATRVRARDGFHYDQPAPGLLEWMPSMKAGAGVTLKTVGYHPDNPRRHGLPTIISTLALYDLNTGHLVGLADGTLMTAMRTAAASAVASRVLARPASRTVGLIGCGAQAVTQLHALTRCFDLRQVLICDTDAAAQASFQDRTRAFAPGSLEIKPAAAGLLVQTADIVCTSTSVAPGAGPVFDDVETKPWLHVNAVGSDFAGKIELPKALLERSLVCPDHLEQALKEGESQQLDPAALGPDLPRLVREAERYSRYRERRTVFDSTGWAMEDCVAMALLLEYASEHSIGRQVVIEQLPEDPLNPYGFDLGDEVEAEQAGEDAG